MKYVVAGNAVADCITYADGRTTQFLPGGATLFALTGIQLWTDQVLMCGGFGQDYMQSLGQWLDRNPVNREGFHVCDPKHPLNYLYYRDEGGWEGKAAYGAEHYDRLSCDPARDGLERFLPDAVGVTTFRGEDPAFFEQMIALKAKYNFYFCWEIKGDFAVREKLDRVLKLLAYVDAFSINQPEAFSLLDVNTDEKAIAAMQAWNLPLVIYRVGKRGIYIIKGKEVLFAPSYQKYPLVDVTGCGNSSTAAAFYAWCEGMDIYDIASYANVTAGHNIRFSGVMELTEEIKKQALADERAFARQLREHTGDD